MAYQKKTKEQLQEEMNSLSAKIKEGVSEMLTSGKYKEYLRMMAKFPSYSVANCILIMMQRPTAKYVCGYVTWKNEFKRHVIKGEKAIQILGVSPRKGSRKVKDADGNEVTEEYTYIKYFPCAVFADDQTEGEEIPTLCKELSGEMKDFDSITEKLKSISSVPITFEDIRSDAKGYFSPAENKIVVQDGMSNCQTIKTIVHEMAHSILHCNGGSQEKVDRDTKEIQAESVAYMVCTQLGINSEEYSFPYLTSWASDKGTKAIRENLDIIKETAEQIISRI